MMCLVDYWIHLTTRVTPLAPRLEEEENQQASYETHGAWKKARTRPLKRKCFSKVDAIDLDRSILRFGCFRNQDKAIESKSFRQ